MAGRNWCFTLNNPIDNDGPVLREWLEKNCVYGVIGCERGAEGTFHWQGYFEMLRPIRFTTLTKVFKQWHLEQRRGTRDQAADYCKKDGDFVEFGAKRIQGRRTDLDAVREQAIDGGMRLITLIGNLQQIRVAEKFLTYNEEPRNWETEVIYITGPSGVGKSKLAREMVAERGMADDCYTKNTGTKWWDGYDGHEAVIIDDFRDSWWPVTYFLGLLDRYEFQIETKGGQRQFKPRLLLITCIRPLEAHYANTGECTVQITRRVGHVIDLTPIEEYPDDWDIPVTDVTEVGGVILGPPDM